MYYFSKTFWFWFLKLKWLSQALCGDETCLIRDYLGVKNYSGKWKSGGESGKLFSFGCRFPPKINKFWDTGVTWSLSTTSTAGSMPPVQTLPKKHTQPTGHRYTLHWHTQPAARDPITCQSTKNINADLHSHDIRLTTSKSPNPRSVSVSPAYYF